MTSGHLVLLLSVAYVQLSALGHVATPELFLGWWCALCHGTCGDTGALYWWMACSMPQGTWQSQSSLPPGAGLEPLGWYFKSSAHGYPIYRVSTLAPGPPRERWWTRTWGQYLFPAQFWWYLYLMILRWQRGCTIGHMAIFDRSWRRWGAWRGYHDVSLGVP
jgi:hypothetical protein